MINPNRSYKAKPLATIIKIDSHDAYIPYITIKTECGRTYEGSLTRCHSRWKSLKVGMTVAFEGQLNVMADKYMISKIIVKRPKKTKTGAEVITIEQGDLKGFAIRLPSGNLIGGQDHFNFYETKEQAQAFLSKVESDARELGELLLRA